MKNDFGSIDILVHSLANGPEVKPLSLTDIIIIVAISSIDYLVNLLFPSKVTKPLLETSRRGYLAAVSASSYSFISLLQHFLPIMNPGNTPYIYACYSVSILTIFFFCRYATVSVLFGQQIMLALVFHKFFIGSTVEQRTDVSSESTLDFL